jgi:hypothetical protein
LLSIGDEANSIRYENGLEYSVQRYPERLTRERVYRHQLVAHQSTFACAVPHLIAPIPRTNRNDVTS